MSDAPTPPPAHDAFLGAWLVSEVVFNPDGGLAGVVHQRRVLHRAEEGRIRVTQTMRPEPALNKHAMGAFRGTWVFELVSDGRARRYLGPDVVGTGLSWGNGAITGSGVWPRFGHNFSSFGVLLSPERQLTGGKFFNAGELVANICGLAVADPAQGEGPFEACTFPEFAQPWRASEISARWQGNCRTVNADGSPAGERTLTRQLRADQLDEGEGLRLTFAPQPGRAVLSGQLGPTPAHGVAKRSGWLFELELYTPDGHAVHMMDLLDPASRTLLSIRRQLKDHVLTHIEIATLHPADPDTP
jgi:hypothetical protein